jgi:hypothetical protein
MTWTTYNEYLAELAKRKSWQGDPMVEKIRQQVEKEYIECCVYWVYGKGHKDPKTQGYVGITKNEKVRIKCHLNHFHEAVGYKILFRGTRRACKEFEYALRPTFNIGWNISHGGTTGWSLGSIEKLRKAKTGIPRSKELKEKLRAINTGKKHTEATKRKVSASLIGNTRSHHSEVVRDKIRKARLGTKASEETKRKLSAMRKGKKRSAKTCDKIRQALLGKKHTYERRQAISKAMTGNRRASPSEEARKNLSVALKGRTFSEETKAKMSAAAKRRCAKPEWKADAAKRIKQQWTDPAFQAKQWYNTRNAVQL